MSRYWSADAADGRILAEGYSGEWPIAPQVAAGMPKGDGSEDDTDHRFLLAVQIYTDLRKLRPDGGEIPWAEVPEWIKLASAFTETPAKLCVSF